MHSGSPWIRYTINIKHWLKKRTSQKKNDWILQIHTVILLLLTVSWRNVGSKGLKWQCQIREQQNTFQHTSCQITGTHSCKTVLPAALMFLTKPSKNTYKNSSWVKPQLSGSLIPDPFLCISQSRCFCLCHQYFVSKLSDYSQLNEWSSSYSINSSKRIGSILKRVTISTVIVSSLLDWKKTQDAGVHTNPEWVKKAYP